MINNGQMAYISFKDGNYRMKAIRMSKSVIIACEVGLIQSSTCPSEDPVPIFFFIISCNIFGFSDFYIGELLSLYIVWRLHDLSYLFQMFLD